MIKRFKIFSLNFGISKATDSLIHSVKLLQLFAEMGDAKQQKQIILVKKKVKKKNIKLCQKEKIFFIKHRSIGSTKFYAYGFMLGQYI